MIMIMMTMITKTRLIMIDNDNYCN